jgi:hypothetical protein
VLADAVPDLVTDDDRRQNVAAGGAPALAHCEGGRGGHRAQVSGCREIGVVGGGRIAHDCVRARGVHHRELRPCVEPERSLRRSAALMRHLAKGLRRVDVPAHCRARDRARYDDLRVLDGARRQILEVRVGCEFRKCG